MEGHQLQTIVAVLAHVAHVARHLFNVAPITKRTRLKITRTLDPEQMNLSRGDQHVHALCTTQASETTSRFADGPFWPRAFTPHRIEIMHGLKPDYAYLLERRE